MFPLGTVLFPGEVLPLHVFEPRYRRLVIDLLEDDEGEPEFGVTLIERGSEVGGGDERVGIGTVARIVHIEALDEHRYALVAVGTRRVAVRAWLPDDPYPFADVDDLPDPAVVVDLSSRLGAALERVTAVYRRAAELGQAIPDRDLSISEDPIQATYDLGSLAPLGPADRYRILAADDAVQRLERLEEALEDVEAILNFRLS